MRITDVQDLQQNLDILTISRLPARKFQASSDKRIRSVFDVENTHYQS